MKPVQQALNPIGDRAPIQLTDTTGFLVPRETVNLNSLIAAAVKSAGHVCGGIILRMDELPQVSVFAAQMEKAFHLLLQALVAQKDACSKVYCYVQGAPAGPSLHDRESGGGVFSVTIHTNVHGGNEDAARPLLQEAARLFAQNKIGLEHKGIPAGGMLFTLTLYSCAQPLENGPRL